MKSSTRDNAEGKVMAWRFPMTIRMIALVTLSIFFVATVVGCGTSSGTNDDAEGGGGIAFLPDENAFTGTVGDEWRPTSDKSVACPWLPQVPPGDWTNTVNCGPASLLMAISSLTGSPASPGKQDIIDLITWMDENVDSYGGVGTNYNGSITTTEMLTSVANNHFSFEARRMVHGTLEDLYDQLVAGRPVIVATYTQGTNNAPSDVMVSGGAGHFMLLVGMSGTHVFLHDPGRSAATNGKNRNYTIESFLKNWQGHAGVVFGPLSPENVGGVSP